MRLLWIPVALLTLVAAASSRTWTLNDGRKLEADFVSANLINVTLRRASDGQPVTLLLFTLSREDQAWIKTASVAAKPAASAASEFPGATAPAKPIEGPFASLITGDWALSEYRGLPFALYASKELNSTQKYPLVLALHGKSKNNENGKQVGGFMKSFAKAENYATRPCIIVAPLCYQPFGASGGGWSDKPSTEVITLLKELIKVLPVDPARVYCVGHSMGGYGTCHLINVEPRLFAAGVAVAGCTGPETAPTFKKVPLWLFHAADDPTVAVSSSRNLAEALKRDKDCHYTELPTGGHGIIGKVFEDASLHEWLFSQRRK